jgi:hypothetical protein
MPSPLQPTVRPIWPKGARIATAQRSSCAPLRRKPHLREERQMAIAASATRIYEEFSPGHGTDSSGKTLGRWIPSPGGASRSAPRRGLRTRRESALETHCRFPMVRPRRSACEHRGLDLPATTPPPDPPTRESPVGTRKSCRPGPGASKSTSPRSAPSPRKTETAASESRENPSDPGRLPGRHRGEISACAGAVGRGPFAWRDSTAPSHNSERPSDNPAEDPISRGNRRETC